MKKYWFTLYPDTFLWSKGEKGFVYNALNNLSYLFSISGRVEELCKELQALENLYSTCISEEDMMDISVQQFIKTVVGLNGGCLSGDPQKPVSLKPVLKVQEGQHFIRKHHYGWYEIGNEIKHYLHQLTFYTNSSSYGNDTWYRQAFFPLKGCGQLNMEKLLTFSRYSRNPNLHHVNLVGNIFTYPEYQRLLEGLKELNIPHTVHITLPDFLQNLKQVNDPHMRFNILIDALPDELVSLKDIPAEINVQALVFSETNFHLLAEKFENMPVYCDAQLTPIYNGENIKFFESFVFTERKEIETIALNKREIFMRQALNVHHFGKFTVMPNGVVYADVNSKPLGTIDDTVHSLIYKEFTEGRSWFYVRDQPPCDDCLYQWLCSSPSNYETIIGKPNLCHVSND